MDGERLAAGKVNYHGNQNEWRGDLAEVHEVRPGLRQSPQQGETGPLENCSSLSLQVPETHTALSWRVLLPCIRVSLLAG